MIATHYCEQGSDDWYALRLGIPTMSKAGTILAKGKGTAESLTRRRYLHELAAERITGKLGERYTNSHMGRGRALEAMVRDTYAFAHGVEPEQIGFIMDTDLGCGCSPDALIGTDGTLEIKTTLPYLQVELLSANRPPPEHKAQMQGGLWITGREWCDLVVYSEGLPPYVDRARRDERYIADLAAAVMRFNEDLEEVIYRVRKYGTPLTELLRESV